MSVCPSFCCVSVVCPLGVIIIGEWVLVVIGNVFSHDLFVQNLAKILACLLKALEKWLTRNNLNFSQDSVTLALENKKVWNHG